MIGVKAKCKNCNREAPADQFKLHYKYKMVVCPECFSGRNEQKQKAAEQKKVEKPLRPKGWDMEDEYLDKFHRLKEKDQPKANFTQIPGTNQVKCTCGECKFTFNYDAFRKSPKNCPYCNAEIPRMGSVGLL